MKISPPEVVIREFGGVRKLARLLGKNPSGISRWKRRKRVPTACQRRILELARERGVNITAEDLIMGRYLAPESASA